VIAGSSNNGCNHLSPELWFAQTLLEFDFVVTFDQTYPQGRRDEILRLSFHTFYHVFSSDDGLDVLGDGGVGSCTRVIRDRKLIYEMTLTNAVLIHQAHQVGFREEVGFRCLTIT
jgi:hypothetical protein